MPAWIQVFQALLTPVVAVAVAVIAFLQWRTAHQKVVLDLFEKRLSVFTQAREAVHRVMIDGKADHVAHREILEALDGSTFIFGSDVREYLHELANTFALLNAKNAEMEIDARAAPERRAAFDKIIAFYRRAPELLSPYMRMDQKRVRTPREWFEDRNRIRLSYADEKQR
ncbi:hypothetical protein ASE04_21200 [Rhizobium sp. Root708]|uniref:hypothetical protein n=1 Tax=Rhizobium sp. Root708 TaxID=1736592 RepID=UPI0006FD8174|nr:hypothetical protein [Rhizobium sp. Root708]KRB61385.1 hypothetical protein ASE04_21200 [Rhizobium sp. Root708]